MWIRTWTEHGEAWGSSYEVGQEEMMQDPGEAEAKAARQIVDNGEISESYYTIDDISEEEIQFDPPYQDSFIFWYEGLSDDEVESLDFDEVLLRINTSFKAGKEIPCQK